MVNKILINILLIILLILLSYSLGSNSYAKNDDYINDKNIKIKSMDNYAYISVNNTVYDVVNHPAFQGFGRFILPLDQSSYNENIEIKLISSLLPYHSNVNSDSVVSTINNMIDLVINGKLIFYEFYSNNQKLTDPSKKSTGLFFFRGDPGKPFAVICPGGGFSYVGSIHEGFPHAIYLNKKGYNAFVLQYRVGGEQKACEDLAMAISFILKNSNKLKVNSRYYSVWGSSAGARMAANIGSYGIAHYGGDNFPRPCVVIMAYTGHSNFTKNDPPTFVISSQDDPIVSIYTVEQRINALRGFGIDVEFRKYKHAGHGFGLGTGTDAEGWIDYAIYFWEKYIRSN